MKTKKLCLIGYPQELHHNGCVVILNINNLPLHKGTTIIVCNNEGWFRADVLEIRLNYEVVESVSEGEIGIKLSRSVKETSELWLQES